MIDTSLIIPLYQGKQYLPYLFDIIAENFRNMKVQLGLACELILVNDEPGSVLSLGGENICGKVTVCNLERNHGIHGARQAGLKLAKGEYVVFLDQDDKITGNYLVSQRAKIGNKDAVVCNGYLTKYCMSIRQHIYTSFEEMKNATDLDSYFSKGNQIISPGQVLIRKKAVPEVWKNYTMKKNGADDFLIWILMLFEGKTFAINEEYLYVHVGHEKNLSNRSEIMNESVREAVQIMREYAGLSDLQKQRFQGENQWWEKAVNPKVNSTMEQIIKIFNRWTYLQTQGRTLEKFFIEKGINYLAIYGLGYIGGRLFEELTHTDVKVVCGIDQRADRVVVENLPVVALGSEDAFEYIQQIQAIVVAVSYDFQRIREMIEEKYGNVEILSFEKIINELL